VTGSSSENSEEEDDAGRTGGATPRSAGAAAVAAPLAAAEDWAAGLQVVNFHMQEEKVRLRWLNGLGYAQALVCPPPAQPAVPAHLAPSGSVYRLLRMNVSHPSCAV